VNPAVVAPARITARDNALLVRVRRLQRSGTAYRKAGELWIEGEHLCGALRARGRVAAQALVSESAWSQPSLRELAQWAPRVARVPDALFSTVSTLPSPSGLGFLVEAPQAPALQAQAPTVIFDRVQDAGNVGSILRSAAALGFTQVLSLAGSAGLWSPKVLRAGMGAHFALDLLEGLAASDLHALQVPMLAASAHASQSLHDAVLPFPCAWVFGHEGQGIDNALAARCGMALRIPQPGGEESLNVAAAAAICLYVTRVRA
jgi:TrmH family RNA methyltransferase